MALDSHSLQTVREPRGGSAEVFIVTGAASGIGRHWAKVLAARGEECRLALADVNEPGLRSTFEESARLRLHALDVRSVEQWESLVDDTVRRFGRIDYLFNIAGGGRPGFLLDVPLSLVDRTIDVNLKGPIYGMKTVGPVMMKQGGGHIVNVSSLAGISPTPGNELYSAAKSGLRAVSLAAAIRLRPRGVFVSVVCPDLVDTPTLTRHLSLDPDDVALIYSGPGPLSVEDVEGAFRRAMSARPLEIALPAWRGWLVRVNNLFPPLMLRLYEPLMRKGRKNFQRLKRERTAGTPIGPDRRTLALRGAIGFLMRRIARIDIRGAEHLPSHGPALLVFNQSSLLDTPLMTMLGRRRDVTGLVARNYRRNPFYRLIVEWGGAIWLRRNSADHVAFKTALAALARGWLVCISPEGRRSPTGALLPGRPGSALLARRAGVPIVPVAITNTRNVARSLVRLRRAPVTVRIGEPFHLEKPAGGDSRTRRAMDTDLIMRRIAALLPPEYRGVYAEGPTTSEEEVR